MWDSATMIGCIFSAITGVGGWLVGRRRQNNDFLNDLQGSVNMLTEENARLLKELIEIRKDNAILMSNQEQMKMEIGALRKENEALRKEVEELNERMRRL